MSTYTNALKGQAAGTTSFIGAIVGGLSNAKANLAAWSERSRVYRELSRMSDRELADIGIGRSDIEHVAGYSDFPSISTNIPALVSAIRQ